MNKLDDRRFISKLDTANMLDAISTFDEQCKCAYNIGKQFKASKPKMQINNILLAGLGGSAIGSDIIRVYLQSELKVPLMVWRNYGLPAFTGKDTLLFCVSYSGNTEEILSSFKEGIRKGAFIITVGSGGELKDLSFKHGLRHIEIPSGFPPRMAVGYMSLAIIAALVEMRFIGDREDEIEVLYTALSAVRDKEIGMEVPLSRNIAKKLAEAIFGTYCIVYGTGDSTEAVGMRWRSQFAENSKTLSSSHIFPEMSHNEISGWEFPGELLKNFKVIMLRDRNDYVGTQKRIDICKSIIVESGAEVFEFERREDSFLARLFCLVSIGDFVSFYLAMLNGVDPTPVRRIDYLKTQLAKN